jgi:predicted GIY-YIG superfamily endonuclease
MIQVKSLRNNRSQILKVSGVYKWYADRDLANEIGIPDTIWNMLTKVKFENKIYGYVYVGMSGNLYKRIGSHLNSKITKSTLRKSIAGLLNTTSKEKISDCIDKFIIEYTHINLDKKEREQIEDVEMAKSVLPLNIDRNKNIYVQEFIQFLREKRRKEITLGDID